MVIDHGGIRKKKHQKNKQKLNENGNEHNISQKRGVFRVGQHQNQDLTNAPSFQGLF